MSLYDRVTEAKSIPEPKSNPWDRPFPGGWRMPKPLLKWFQTAKSGVYTTTVDTKNPKPHKKKRGKHDMADYFPWSSQPIIPGKQKFTLSFHRTEPLADTFHTKVSLSSLKPTLGYPYAPIDLVEPRWWGLAANLMQTLKWVKPLPGSAKLSSNIPDSPSTSPSDYF